MLAAAAAAGKAAAAEAEAVREAELVAAAAVVALAAAQSLDQSPRPGLVKSLQLLPEGRPVDVAYVEAGGAEWPVTVLLHGARSF